MNFAYHFRLITNNSGQFVKYLSLETDVSALRGQLLYRSKNMGLKEIDLIVGSWAQNHIHSLNLEELQKFNKEVLQKETPDLLRKLLGYEEIEKGEEYVNKIRQFALDSSYSKLL